jgi:hypothetical protein
MMQQLLLGFCMRCSLAEAWCGHLLLLLLGCLLGLLCRLQQQ